MAAFQPGLYAGSNRLLFLDPRSVGIDVPSGTGYIFGNAGFDCLYHPLNGRRVSLLHSAGPQRDAQSSVGNVFSGDAIRCE